MPTRAEIEKHLSAKGYKLTKNRRILLQGLLELAEWATAQELFEYVAARNKKVNFSTIYRNLDLLTEIGFLCRVDRNNDIHYYALNHEEGHHHHLICKSCSKVLPLDFCPLSSLGPLDLQNFSDIECKFAVYGYCQDCQSQHLGKRQTTERAQDHKIIPPTANKPPGR